MAVTILFSQFNVILLCFVSVLICIRNVHGQKGICRKAPLKSIIQANGHMQDYCEYVDGKNRMVMFPGSEFTKHCSICKCTMSGLTCCQISATPNPDSIPLGCVAILDGCIYKKVWSTDRKIDCYVGLHMHSAKKLQSKQSPGKTEQSNVGATKVQELMKLTDLLKVPKSKSKNKKNTQQNSKKSRNVVFGTSTDTKPQSNEKTATTTKKPANTAKTDKPQTPNNKNKDHILNTKSKVNIQPFEINSILNGKDTFLVISLKNKVSERSKPQKRKPKQSAENEAKNNQQQGESNQSEAQQELTAKLQRSLNGEYDFTMMDYYNMFSNFQQQTTPAAAPDVERTTTMSSTTNANSIYESNQVSVIAIKSSNTDFMKWLVDTLGNLGLLNATNNQTKNATTDSHRKKLEMVLKSLVNVQGENNTGSLLNYEPTNPISAYVVNNKPGTSITDVKRLTDVISGNLQNPSAISGQPQNDPFGTSASSDQITANTQMHSNVPASKANEKSHVLGSLIDKYVQDAIKKKFPNSVAMTTAQYSTDPETNNVVSRTTLQSPAASETNSGLFSGNLGFLGLSGLGFFDSMNR